MLCSNMCAVNYYINENRKRPAGMTPGGPLLFFETDYS